MDFKFHGMDEDESELLFAIDRELTEEEICRFRKENLDEFKEWATNDISDEEEEAEEAVERAIPKMDDFELLPDLELLEDVENSSSSPLPCKEEVQVERKVMAEKKIQKRRGKKKKKSSSRSRKTREELSSETKNIPKNYGKQIIKFIKKDHTLTERALSSLGSLYSYDQLTNELKKKKKSINKISDLQKLWQGEKFSREFRVLTGVFLRKYCLPWVFNSRIKNIKYPIKYRYRIIEGVEKPEEFIYLKNF
jgi:hypothetical protein